MPQAQFALYQTALKNLKATPDSPVDKLIVDLWSASKAMHEKNMKLTADLHAMTLRNAELSRSNDQILSKQGDKATTGADYLTNLFAAKAQSEA